MITDSRRLLQHFLAALAYRTQKALRGAPDSFADFRGGENVRTPHELVWHMTSVIGYARTMLHGGALRPAAMPTFGEEVARFHAMLESVHRDLGDDTLTAAISDEQFLQGPFADAMTHAGQLAMLRRLHGVPIPPENFIRADVRTDHVGADQAAPAAPDEGWTPEQSPPPVRAADAPRDGSVGRALVTLRTATPADRDAVMNLVPRLRSFGDVPLRSNAELDRAEGETLERALATPEPDARLVVAEIEGAGVVGVVYMQTETDYFSQARQGHLGILIVAEHGEGRGVGRALIRETERWALERGFRFLSLNVFAANQRARRVYERAGFVLDTVRYLKELGAGD